MQQPIARTIGALFVAFLAMPAPADTPAPETAQAPRPVCKRETVTGSRLPGRKMCKTEAQWQAEADKAQDFLRDNSRRARTSAP